VFFQGGGSKVVNSVPFCPEWPKHFIPIQKTEQSVSSLIKKIKAGIKKRRRKKPRHELGLQGLNVLRLLNSSHAHAHNLFFLINKFKIY
jgi:hypothetical protein